MNARIAAGARYTAVNAANPRGIWHSWIAVTRPLTVAIGTPITIARNAPKRRVSARADRTASRAPSDRCTSTRPAASIRMPMPRFTAGRARTRASQRLRWGNPSSSLPCRSNSLIQPTQAMSAIEYPPARNARFFEPRVHHAEQTVELVAEAVDRIVLLLAGGIAAEVVRLAGLRSEVGHLPEQPLLDFNTPRARSTDRTCRSCGRGIAGWRLTRTARSAARPARQDRRSPGCGCWARFSGTRA